MNPSRRPVPDPRRLVDGLHARGKLPHIKREGVAYFITFRLADSLPIPVRHGGWIGRGKEEMGWRERDFSYRERPKKYG
jgi:hypothetical protein